MSFRKIVAFLLITCATASSFAQVINGVGDFKIGMSLEEFLDLPLIKEKNLQDRASREYSTDERDLWKTTADSQVQKHDRVYSADIVEFEFRAPLGVSDFMGKNSHNVTTSFYKGKLAKVFVYDAGLEVEKILRTKYGKPILDGSEYSIWGKGKKITATFHFFNGRSSYWVEEGAIVKFMDRINENGRKALEAEEAKVKASASKL